MSVLRISVMGDYLNSFKVIQNTADMLSFFILSMSFLSDYEIVLLYSRIISDKL